MTALDDLAAYDRATNRLLGLIGLIRGERAATSPKTDRIGRATARLARTLALLEAFGNPQHRYSTVHVTGTSGKGSVAAMIAAILSSAGYRVGLRTSPYLQVATEKLQISSRLIDANSLVTHRFGLADAVEALKEAESGRALKVAIRND